MSERTDIEYGPIFDDDFDPLATLLGQALLFADGSMHRWLRDIGVEYVRAVRKKGRLASGIAFIPMGMWFGGVSVRTAGITAVGVAPEYRGSHVGMTMLRRTLEELHAANYPLAALYPATTAFYRKTGFERASTRTMYEMRLDAINARERTIDAVAVEAADERILRQVYAQRARNAAGNLDRPDMMWRNYLEPREQTAHKFLVLRDGQPEGYVIFLQSTFVPNQPPKPLIVHDVCALSAAATERILTLLADHRSVLGKMQWIGAPLDLLTFANAEQAQQSTRSFDLMLRLVDVPAAFAARGYCPGVTAELQLEVFDDVLPWNNGRFTISIADGRAETQPGGEGHIRIDVRTLAAIYSGHLTPFEARMVGKIEAPESHLTLASLALAGPRPWTPDMF